MKLVKPSFEILEQWPGLEGIYEAIERAGRTCYKSIRPEGKTSKDFVDNLIKMQHYAMLEHGTVYLKIPSERAYSGFGDNWVYENYFNKPYSSVNSDNNGDYFVTTNYRVLLEHNWLDDLKYLCEPTEFHEKRVTVKFITSIGVGREFLRHRVFSFANESTRYCNYSSKKKFGGEVTFIIPSWCDDIPDNLHLEDSLDAKEFVWKTNDIAKVVEQEGIITRGVSKFTQRFIYNCLNSEETYIGLIASGYKPQEAREVLPLATKSELVMTGFVSDWNHFFRLRTSIIAETGKPHPDASALADPLYKEFINRNYLKEI